MGRIIGGVMASMGGLALLALSSWLHQPGFAGDPDVRLLDGAAYGVLVLVSFGLLAAGFLLIRKGIVCRRRRAAP